MGRKNSIVSYFCGVLFRSRPPAVEDGDGAHPADILDTPSSSPKAQQEALPRPPGNGKFHMRTFSCGNNMQRQRRSNSGVSRMRLRVPGVKEGSKNLKHEDSVWKKTIILGERCRVPDKDEDGINLYDEKGNEIRTYRPKTYSGLLQYSSLDHKQ